VLLGLTDFPVNRLVELTPSAWAARHKAPQSGEDDEPADRQDRQTLTLDCR
jgi:hypothetical protein